MKNTEQKPKTGRRERRQRLAIPLLGALLIAVFLASFSLGRYPVGVGDVLKILLSRVLPIEETWASEVETVMMNIRLPRIAMACLVGCCLSAAGAAYQGVFQNPMASPDILGASNGAAFGAALAILLGLGAWAVTLGAFAASLVTVTIVFLVAERASGVKIVNLVLAGIMVGSLFSAATSYIKLVADPSNELPAITYWLMGSLSGVKSKDFGFVLIPMALGCGTLFALRWKLNLLTLGDEQARSLGVNTNALRLAVIVASTLVTAASIAVSGVIGWVGLVIPHLTRRIAGSDYRRLMPASMLAGAAFLLVVDDVSRCLLATEIPIGILTAFVGAPFFVYLIMKRERSF